MARRLTASYDTYVRDEEGVWRYQWGEPVPGATDLTSADLAGTDSSEPHILNDAGELVVGIHAPELNVHAMMTVADLAREAGVSKATIDSYRSRGYVPHPQAVMGRTPLWARPIIMRWLAMRPGPGWRSDIKTPGEGVNHGPTN